MSDDVASGLLNLVSTVLSDVHTSMPGTIVSYDPATRRAVVRPSLSKQLADGRVLGAPEIVSVPVVFPSGNGGQAGLTFPVVAGDGVVLHFSERSLESWHTAGAAVPDDPRRFDLTDAVAVPGLNHGGTTVPADPANMVLHFGAASIAFTPAGGCIITAPAGITLIGPTNAPTDPISSMGKVLSLHTHAEHGTGGGITGPPL